MARQFTKKFFILISSIILVFIILLVYSMNSDADTLERIPVAARKTIKAGGFEFVVRCSDKYFTGTALVDPENRQIQLQMETNGQTYGIYYDGEAVQDYEILDGTVIHAEELSAPVLKGVFLTVMELADNDIHLQDIFHFITGIDSDELVILDQLVGDWKGLQKTLKKDTKLREALGYEVMSTDEGTDYCFAPDLVSLFGYVAEKALLFAKGTDYYDTAYQVLQVIETGVSTGLQNMGSLSCTGESMPSPSRASCAQASRCLRFRPALPMRGRT